MRTLRVFLAGAAALVLVGTGAAGVVAQVEPEVATGPDYAWVESVTQSNCGFDDSQTTEGEGDGYTSLRGHRYDCDLEASDPRVSGKLTGVFGNDCFGDPDVTCIFWDTQEIANSDGSWTGWVWGTHRPEDIEDPQHAWMYTAFQVFTGHGAYEGLTFIVHGEGPGEDVDFHGLIYEGVAPPPLGELPFAMPSADAEPTEEPAE
jgi:hypothetical protein